MYRVFIKEALNDMSMLVHASCIQPKGCIKTWPDYIHVYNGEHVTIIRLYMRIVIYPKIISLLLMTYCQCLTIMARVSLAVNIIVQRLDIDVALDILRWDVQFIFVFD